MTTSIISKELVATLTEKLEAAAAKMVKGLTVGVDSEVDPKEGYCSVTVYFENTDQVKAIAKAKAAIAKQVAEGTLGQPATKPAPHHKPTTPAPKENTAPAAELKSTTVKNIISLLGEYGYTLTEKQVQLAWSGKPDAKTKKIIAEVLGDTAEQFTKKGINLFVALLIVVEFTSKDAKVKAVLEAAQKKGAKVFEAFEEDEEAEEESKEEDEEAEAESKEEDEEAEEESEEEADDEEAEEEWEDDDIPADEEADEEWEEEDEEPVVAPKGKKGGKK